MPAIQALTIGRADLGDAPAQDDFLAVGFLDHVGAGIAVRDRDGRFLLALGTSETLAQHTSLLPPADIEPAGGVRFP